MGSGHILVYAFDVLMEIYRECGYSDRDAALNIVQNNLLGLDIDDRAYQIAYFAVMMKARSYNRRALSQGIWHNLCAIQESNGIERFTCEDLTTDKEKNQVGEYLVRQFRDAKEIGSLVSIEKKDYKSFAEYLLNIEAQGQIDFTQSGWLQTVQPLVLRLTKQAEILSEKYCVVATNPPYLGKMQGQLKKFVVDNYKDYSGDLFAAFMYRNFDFCINCGYSVFMTPFVWMFIGAYAKLRQYIICRKSIISLIQMEYSAFEEATVPICAFVMKNGVNMGKGNYIKLSEFKGGMEVLRRKVLEALSDSRSGFFYSVSQEQFMNIPSMPIAYNAPNGIFEAFLTFDKVDAFYEVRNGITTGDNNLFLKLWFEVCVPTNKWYACNKGGSFRKWYEEIFKDLRKNEPGTYKFINETNHIENDYVFQLNPLEFYTIPELYLVKLRQAIEHI